MSRADERYLMKLFEMEVPEIYDNIVEIKAAAREPGSRAKIAVSSKDPRVDPVGACVGMKGSRVQNIVQELKGEKIDIVPWHEDQTRFVCNALAPAEVSKVIIDEGSREMEIVVPDNQLSLAIGKKGQNVRLAAKLTGWKLDILSETKVQAKTQEAIFNLMLIPGISETMAQNIYQSGYAFFTRNLLKRPLTIWLRFLAMIKKKVKNFSIRLKTLSNSTNSVANHFPKAKRHQLCKILRPVEEMRNLSPKPV